MNDTSNLQAEQTANQFFIKTVALELALIAVCRQIKKEVCVVFDSENWHCSNKNMTNYSIMNNGDYSDSGYFDIKTQITLRQQVAVTVYWYNFWKNFFG